MSSSPSYEIINYSLRPAKSVERRMIVEVCSRLRSFYNLESYRYVGFGSPYFSDFSLIHRALDISEMICIEKEKADAPRFEFNKPFHCITLKFGTSSEILPMLEWRDRPTIIWLDYDSSLDESILSDIDVAASNLVSGSLLILSMRASANDFGDEPDERKYKLQETIGNKIPLDIPLNTFSNTNFSYLLWKIINAEIDHVVLERSAGLRSSTKFEYSQLLHFNYRDGVKMITIGGLIFQSGQRSTQVHCDFGALPFMKNGEEAYKIEVPKLTLKELRALNEQLPSSEVALPCVPSRDIRAYVSNYRYFPTFVEAEL